MNTSPGCCSPRCTACSAAARRARGGSGADPHERSRCARAAHRARVDQPEPARAGAAHRRAAGRPAHHARRSRAAAEPERGRQDSRRRSLYGDLEKRLAALETLGGVGARRRGGRARRAAAGGRGGSEQATYDAAFNALQGARTIRQGHQRRSASSSLPIRRSPLASNAQYWLGEATTSTREYRKRRHGLPEGARPTGRIRARRPTRWSRSASRSRRSASNGDARATLEEVVRALSRHARPRSSPTDRLKRLRQMIEAMNGDASEVEPVATPPEDHRDLLFAAGRGRHRGLSHGVRAPHRLPAALPVLRYRVCVSRRRVAHASRTCWRRSPSIGRRATCASPAASRWRRRTACHCSTRLCDANYRVSLETSGAMPLGWRRSARDPRRGREDAGLGRGAAQSLRRARAAAARGADQVRDLRSRRLRMEPRARSRRSVSPRAARCCSQPERRAVAGARSSPTGFSPTGCRCVSSCSSTRCSGAMSQENERSNEHVPRAVVLLSGGLDSATVLALARAAGPRVLRAVGVLRPAPPGRAQRRRARRARARRARASHHARGPRRASAARRSPTHRSPCPTDARRGHSRSPTSRRATPSCCRWRWPGPRC